MYSTRYETELNYESVGPIQDSVDNITRRAEESPQFAVMKGLLSFRINNIFRELPRPIFPDKRIFYTIPVLCGHRTDTTILMGIYKK